MADYNTYRSVVECIVLVHVKERVLQNSRREAYLICCRVVVGIHCLRCHEPLIAVNGLAPFLLNVLVPIELRKVAAGLVIGQGWVDCQFAVVIPFVGVANLYGKGIQLIVCSLFGLVTHPLLCIDALSQCHLKVLYKLYHALLCCRREVLCNIKLANDVTQGAVNGCESTFPAWLLHLFATQYCAVESECLGFDFVAQLIGCCTHNSPLQIGYEFIHRSFIYYSNSLLYGFGVCQVQLLNAVDTKYAVECVPIKSGCHIFQLLECDFVVAAERIAAFHAVEVLCCNACLNLHYRLHILLCLLFAEAIELEHTHYIFAELCTDVL